MRATILLPFLLLAGCHAPGDGGNGAAPPANGAAAAPSPLDAEAARESTAFWNTMLTRCGRRIFTAGYVSGWSADGPSVRIAPDRYGSVSELDGVSWSAVPSDLSRADQLNGVEWRGVTVVAAKAVREKYAAADDFGLWRSPNGDVPGHADGAFAAELTRIHGSWMFNGIPLSAIRPVKVDCAHPLLFPPASTLAPPPPEE